MRLVTDGQLFTVLAAQVLSPLTISPRVSLCSSVLSSASESVLPQHLDWGSSTLLVLLEAVFQNRLHPLLPPFIFCLLKRCAQCMNSIVCLILPGGLLDLLLLVFFSFVRLCTMLGSASVCMISQSWKIHTYFLGMVHHIPKVSAFHELYCVVEG